MVEQALSCLITLKLNPDVNKKQADSFLKNLQNNYTLGKAIKKAKENKLLNESFQVKLDSFLKERNWLIHKSLAEVQQVFDCYDKRRGIIISLCNRIKEVSGNAEVIKREIEYDMIDFCETKNRDMSHLRELVKFQERGVRIYKI